MNSEELKIKPFDTNKFKNSKVIVIIGNRNSGKSTLVKDILNGSEYKEGIIVSQSEELQRSYENTKNIHIFSEYNHNILERLIKTINKYGGRDHPHAFLVLDNVLTSDDLKNKVFKEFFINSRHHYKLTLIVTITHPLLLSPLLRDNIDYTFILRSMRSDIIYDKYTNGCFGDKKKLFDETCSMLTNNYKCLVIDNVTHSLELSDQVFVYKAKFDEKKTEENINSSSTGYLSTLYNKIFG